MGDIVHCDRGIELIGAEALEKDKRLTLADIIKADKLFEQHPWLRNIPVEIQTSTAANGTTASYVKHENGEEAIRINEDFLDSAKKASLTDNPADERNILDVLTHEIQHAVQEREDFSPGAGVDYWEKKAEGRLLDRRNGIISTWDRETYDKYERYRRLANKEAKVGLNGKESTRINDLYDELYKLPRWLELADIDNKLDNKDYGTLGVDSPIDLYTNTAGETEARDTASRRNLTARQRREQFPQSMEPSDRVVFADGSGTAYMADEDNTQQEYVPDVKPKRGKSYVQYYERKRNYAVLHGEDAYEVFNGLRELLGYIDDTNGIFYAKATSRIGEVKSKAVWRMYDLKTGINMGPIEGFSKMADAVDYAAQNWERLVNFRNSERYQKEIGFLENALKNDEVKHLSKEDAKQLEKVPGEPGTALIRNRENPNKLTEVRGFVDKDRGVFYRKEVGGNYFGKAKTGWVAYDLSDGYRWTSSWDYFRTRREAAEDYDKNIVKEPTDEQKQQQAELRAKFVEDYASGQVTRIENGKMQPANIPNDEELQEGLPKNDVTPAETPKTATETAEETPKTTTETQEQADKENAAKKAIIDKLEKGSILHYNGNLLDGYADKENGIFYNVWGNGRVEAYDLENGARIANFPYHDNSDNYRDNLDDAVLTFIRNKDEILRSRDESWERRHSDGLMKTALAIYSLSGAKDSEFDEEIFNLPSDEEIQAALDEVFKETPSEQMTEIRNAAKKLAEDMGIEYVDKETEGMPEYVPDVKLKRGTVLELFRARGGGYKLREAKAWIDDVNGMYYKFQKGQWYAGDLKTGVIAKGFQSKKRDEVMAKVKDGWQMVQGYRAHENGAQKTLEAFTEAYASGNIEWLENSERNPVNIPSGEKVQEALQKQKEREEKIEAQKKALVDKLEEGYIIDGGHLEKGYADKKNGIFYYKHYGDWETVDLETGSSIGGFRRRDTLGDTVLAIDNDKDEVTQERERIRNANSTKNNREQTAAIYALSGIKDSRLAKNIFNLPSDEEAQAALKKLQSEDPPGHLLYLGNFRDSATKLAEQAEAFDREASITQERTNAKQADKVVTEKKAQQEYVADAKLKQGTALMLLENGLEEYKGRADEENDIFYGALEDPWGEEMWRIFDLKTGGIYNISNTLGSAKDIAQKTWSEIQRWRGSQGYEIEQNKFNRLYAQGKVEWLEDSEKNPMNAPKAEAETQEQTAENIDNFSDTEYNNTEEVRANGRDQQPGERGNNLGGYRGVSENGQIQQTVNAVGENDTRRGNTEQAFERRNTDGNLLLSEATASALRARDIEPLPMRRANSAEEFRDAILEAKASSPNGGFVEAHTIEEYEEMELYLCDGREGYSGKAGVAVTKDGNIVSVFNSPNSGYKNALDTLIPLAIEHGGIKLDNYDGFLSDAYQRFGFIPVSKTRFSREAALGDWNYERFGEPDVIFWIHNGDDAATVVRNKGQYTAVDTSKLREFGSYAEAEEYRDNLIKRQATQNEPSVSSNTDETQDNNEIEQENGNNDAGNGNNGGTPPNEPPETASETPEEPPEEPLDRLRIELARAKAEAREGKVYTRDDALKVTETLVNNLGIDSIFGESGQKVHMTKKDKGALATLVGYALNSKGTEKSNALERISTFIARRAKVTEEGASRGGTALYDVVTDADDRKTVVSTLKGTLTDALGDDSLGRASVLTEAIEKVRAEKDSVIGKLRTELETERSKANANAQKVAILEKQLAQKEKEYSAKEKRLREQLDKVNAKVKAEREKRQAALKKQRAELKAKYQKKIEEARRAERAKVNNAQVARENAEERKKNIAVRARAENIPPNPDIQEKIEEYGALPIGERPSRIRREPKKISKRQYVSRAARTMIEAGVTPTEMVSEFEKRILDGTMTYERVTDDNARDTAEKMMAGGTLAENLKKWNDRVASGAEVTKGDIAFGQTLYAQLAQAKDVENATKVAADLSVIATRAGQMVQAQKLLKDMSPDGQLYALEQTVEKINADLKDRFGDKAEAVEIDMDLARQFLEAETEELRNELNDILQAK